MFEPVYRASKGSDNVECVSFTCQKYHCDNSGLKATGINQWWTISNDYFFQQERAEQPDVNGALSVSRSNEGCLLGYP